MAGSFYALRLLIAMEFYEAECLLWLKLELMDF